jgi:hypothetical protein
MVWYFALLIKNAKIHINLSNLIQNCVNYQIKIIYFTLFAVFMETNYCFQNFHARRYFIIHLLFPFVIFTIIFIY